MENVKYTINIRLPPKNKEYYKNHLEQFTKYFNNDKVLSVQFGKQDIRGTESITIVDKRHCVPEQKFFYNKWELLGFVIGFNTMGENDSHSYFNRWLK